MTSGRGKEDDPSISKHGSDTWTALWSERGGCQAQASSFVDHSWTTALAERTGDIRQVRSTGYGVVGEQYISLVKVSFELLNLEANGETAREEARSAPRARRASRGSQSGPLLTSWIQGGQASEAHLQ